MIYGWNLPEVDEDHVPTFNHDEGVWYATGPGNHPPVHAPPPGGTCCPVMDGDGPTFDEGCVPPCSSHCPGYHPCHPECNPPPGCGDDGDPPGGGGDPPGDGGDPCDDDPCDEDCASAPCNPICGGDPCDPECDLVEECDPMCNPECNPNCDQYDPCKVQCDDPPCDMVPVCDDGGGGGAIPPFVCVREIRTYTAPDCPPSCTSEVECEPGEWEWEIDGPAVILTDPPTGSSIDVQYRGPGEVTITATNGCCQIQAIEVTAVQLRLESVRFGGTQHPVARDTTGTPYAPADTPHWSYGVADQAEVVAVDPYCDFDEWYWDDGCYLLGVYLGSDRFPVAYTRSVLGTDSHVVIERVRFRIEPESLALTHLNAAYWWPFSEGTMPLEHVDGPYYENPAPFAIPQWLPSSIAYYQDMKIIWAVDLTIDVSDDPGEDDLVDLTCFSAHSENTLYVTLANPQTSPLYHTVIHRASAHAIGANTEQAAIDGIWSYFQGMVVQNFENEPVGGFRYWGPAGEGCATTQCLIMNFDGQCGAWSRFMRDVLKIHGIAATSNGIVPDIDAIPTNVSNPDGGPDLAVLGAPGFDVKNTNFPNAPWDPPATYPSAPSGVPGQGGVANPTSRFADHAVTVANGMMYDPSYGKGPYVNLRLWQTDALASVSVIVDRPGHGISVYNLLNEGASWEQLVEWD